MGIHSIDAAIRDGEREGRGEGGKGRGREGEREGRGEGGKGRGREAEREGEKMDKNRLIRTRRVIQQGVQKNKIYVYIIIYKWVYTPLMPQYVTHTGISQASYML